MKQSGQPYGRQLATDQGGAPGIKLDRRLRAVLVFGVVMHVLAFLYVTIQRVSYPFELEWMEGALVDHTSRILRGEDIYTAPSVDHVSYLYTPLYYYVSALVSSLTGLGFLPLRLVSLAASLGCALCIALIVKREATNGGFVPAVVGGGFFLAGFWLVDGWHDLARNDSLFLLLILITVMLLRADTDRRALLAGIVVVLAFLSKQLTLALLPPLAIGMACLSIRRAVLFTVSTSVCLAVTVGVYCWLTDGWFFYYIFEVPGQHPSVPGIEFWWRDMRPMWISLAAGLFWFVTGLGWADRRKTLFHTCVAGGLLVSAYVARHHAGGYINALMPWLVGGGLLMGLALQRAVDCHIGVRLGLTIAMIGQFVSMVDTSRSFLPSPAHRREFTKFYTFLRGVEDQVFVPCHGHVAEAVGTAGSLHGMAMHDLQSSKTEGYKILLESIVKAYSERRFKVIVISEPYSEVFLGKGKKLIPGYRLLENPPFDHHVMKPLHGTLVTPALVFERVD